MSETISFTLDGKKIKAAPGESIWQVAKRHGILLPHLCHKPAPGYQPDGNCRACMVEIEGERVLSASCIRTPTPGMKVKTKAKRAVKARKMVMELLLADHPPRDQAHDSESHFWHMAEAVGVDKSRFPCRETPPPDNSHPAMSVQLDACIQCGLCTRACRKVQVNDVIGMAFRGAKSKIVFDFDHPMGDSTCVACGECVQACPTGALMEATLVDEDGRGPIKADTRVNSLCPYCGVGCQLTFNVREGKLLSAEGRDGPANRNRLCVKGRFGFDYVHHPHRLTTPMIRKAGVRKISDESFNPADPLANFHEVSWEQALDEAGGGFRHLRDREGTHALAGFGCAKGSNEEAYLFQKLVRTGFRNNNVDHCTRMCHASSVAALMETIGSGAVTAPVSECLNSEVIFVIGARPAQNHPVAATFIKNAVKNGAILIVADPRSQALSRHAEHMLQFRPGTDVALLNAMIHTIIKEDLVDSAYIEAHTEGYKDLKKYTAYFTPEEMSAVCGIPPETLREVARTYAKANSALIFWGMGISQHVHGTDNARCLISLALITGNIGKPGAGLHPLRGQNNVQGASDVGLIPMVYPDYQSVTKPEARGFFEQFWGTPLNPNEGLTVVEIMDAIRNREIMGLYVMGENPAMSDPDTLRAREALCQLEHMVAQDIFMTETAFLADVILPASAFPEKNGTFTNTDRRVQMAHQAVEPPGDARQDLWIIQQMAQRLGLNWKDDSPRQVYEELRQCMPSITGITWERLEKEGTVTYPCVGADDPGQEIIFGDKFPTDNGLGKLVPTEIMPPDETPDNHFPLVLTTGRLLEHWHTGSMTRRARVLDNIEPEATVHLSPADMSRFNLKPGDRVRVSTRRGAIELKARSDRQIRIGMIFIPFCFHEASANALTNPALDPFGKIPELKYCSARVEKIDMEEPEGEKAAKITAA